MPDIIVAEARHDSAIYEAIRQQHEIYWVDREAAQPKFTIENVSFEHDPQWRNRIMSIQCAHDGNHAIWVAARYAFVAASVAPYVLRLMA